MAKGNELQLDIDTIVLLYVDKKWTSTQIAEKLECSSRTIIKRLRSYNVTTRHPSPPRIVVDVSEAVRLYAQGLSTTKLAVMFGVNRNIISRILKENGTQLRGFGEHARKAMDDSDILDMYDSGSSMSAIAEKHNTSVATISKRLKENSVVLREPGSYHRIDIDKDSLTKMYLEKMKSAKEIARILGCGPNTVISKLERMGIVVRNDCNRKKDIKKKDIRRLYLKDKLSVNEVARKLGCSASVMRERLLDMRIEIRDTRLELDEDRIIHMYTKLGMPANEIAEAIGCAHNVIRRRLRENGICIRPSSRFGSIKIFKAHGHLVKLGSGWEKHVYSILWKEFGDNFLFQGEFGDRQHKQTPKFTLNKPTLPIRYKTNKDTYLWHPDFVIPSLNIILEVKGGWRARQRWNQCILPCIGSTPDFQYEIYEMRTIPYKIKTWAELKDILVKHEVQ